MKDNHVYLIHVRDSIHRIETYTVEGKTAFFADLKTQDTVIRNLQTLCESTQRLPDDWKALCSDIDWRTIGDFRNILAHQYLDIDLDIVECGRELSARFKSSGRSNFPAGLDCLIEARS